MLTFDRATSPRQWTCSPDQTLQNGICRLIQLDSGMDTDGIMGLMKLVADQVHMRGWNISLESIYLTVEGVPIFYTNTLRGVAPPGNLQPPVYISAILIDSNNHQVQGFIPFYRPAP
jgi:hypothetical protein